MQGSEQRPHKDTIRVLSVRNGPGSRKFADINAEPAVEEQPAPAGAAGGLGRSFRTGAERGPGRQARDALLSLSSRLSLAGTPGGWGAHGPFAEQ